MDNIVNLADYGLKTENAAASNDSAFKSAISAITAKAGYMIIPAGTFDISASINLPESVSLVGCGNASVLRAVGVINGGMVRIVGSSGHSRNAHRIENVILNGNNLATIGVEFAYAVYTNVVRNVRISNCKTAGIYLTAGSCWGNTFDNVFISYCGRGFHLGESANATRLLNCAIYRCTGAGVYMETATGNLIQGCAIEKNAQGVLMLGGMASLIAGCYFEGQTDTDIFAYQGPQNGTDGLTIVGCYFNGLETAVNALNISNGAATIIGGYSNRHTGRTIITGTDGIVHDFGFIREN